MEQDLSERIRARAYEKWIASGFRDGEAEQHWLAAEREIRAALGSKAASTGQRGRTIAKRSNVPH